MKSALLVALAVFVSSWQTFAQSSPSIQYQAVIPNCCEASAVAMEAVSGTSLQITRTISSGAQASWQPGYFVNFVIEKDGRHAVIEGEGDVIEVVDLTTGEATAPLAFAGINNFNNYPLGVNPSSGVIYGAYTQGTPLTAHLVVINSAGTSILKDIALGSFNCYGFTVSPDGSSIYVGTGSGTIVLNSSNFQKEKVLPYTGGAVFSSDGTKVYIANADTIVTVDTATFSTLATATLPDAPDALGISKDGSQVYATFPELGSFAVLNTVDQSVTTLAAPFGIAQFFTGETGTVFAFGSTNSSEGVVGTVNEATLAIDDIQGLPGSGMMAMSPSANELFFLLDAQSSIAVTGAAPSNTVTRTLLTGHGAVFAAYDSKDQLLLQTVASAAVQIFDTNTWQSRGVVMLPSYPDWIGYNGQTYATYGNLTDGGGLAEINPLTAQVVAEMQFQCSGGGVYGGASGHPVLTSGFAFVPISTEFGTFHTLPCSGVAVFNLETQSLQSFLPVARGDIYFAATPEGSTGYVMDLASDSEAPPFLESIELSTGRVLQQVNLPSGIPSDMTMAPNGETLYLSLAGTVYAVNPTTLAIENSLALPYGQVNLSVSPDSSYLYAACDCGPNQIVILSAASLGIVSTIQSMISGEFGVSPVVFLP